jgi:chemotaxis protein CheX
VASEELAQIVQSVFAVMTGLDVSPCRARWFPSRDRLTAAVRLQGDGNRSVLIECDHAQACRVAGRFLSVAPPKTDDPVVSDVLGELANMIGGNLKCVLNQGADLSIPSVVYGSVEDLDPARVEILERVAFENDGEIFWVTVLAQRN